MQILTDTMSDVDKDTRKEDVNNNDAAVTCDGFIIGWSSFLSIPMPTETETRALDRESAPTRRRMGVVIIYNS